MRRHTYLVVLVVLLVVGAVMPASAGVETALGLLVSWGTEKQQWTSRMVLHEEGTGRDLVPENGIVCPAPDKGIIGQIIFAKDMGFGPEAFRFYWAACATPREGDWHQARYDEKFGYLFRIDPSQYGSNGVYDTPLQLQVWVKNGSKPFIRIILKFTFPKSAVAREALWIRPTMLAPAITQAATPVADPAVVDSNFNEIRQAIGTLEKNQQVIASDTTETKSLVANISARLDRVEKWAEAATGAQAPASAKVNWTLVLPTGKIAVRMTRTLIDPAGPAVVSCPRPGYGWSGTFTANSVPGRSDVEVLFADGTTVIWRDVNIYAGAVINMQHKEVR